MEDMKKFNIIKGEIEAGNDAPEILKEFNNYVIKYMTNGMIPKREASSLLLALACM